MASTDNEPAARDLIRSRRIDNVKHITLTRPAKRNALTQAMYEQLTETIAHAESDDTIGCVLLDADGGTFCAGNDLTEFLAADNDTDVANGPALTFIRKLAASDVPVLAAVQGRATGIGMTLLLHVDLVVAGENATFETPFVSLGLVPEAGASALLPRLVGRQNAARLLLAGDVIDAGQAEAMGLIAYHVADDELAERARKLASRLASQPAGALTESRRLLRESDPLDLNTLINTEAASFRERLGSQEFQAILARKLGR